MTRHAPLSLSTADRPLAGLGAVLLVPAAFIVCWQLARRAPPASPGGDPRSMTWIRFVAPVARPAAALPAPVLSAEVPAAPSAATILENARRSVGAIDRALRKENRRYIVAPPDSPALRLSADMERAHDMVAPKLWEAPKVDELVNQTYCITDRAATSGIDTIETLGKQRLAACPRHEDKRAQQDWRTARGE